MTGPLFDPWGARVDTESRMDRRGAVASKGGRPAVTVTLADDHPLYRYALEQTIRADPELALIGAAHDGRAAIRLITSARPDVALIDLTMPGADGLEVIAAVRADESCSSRVLVVSAHVGPEHVERAMSAGAAGYLSKDVDRTQLREAILTIARSGAVFSPKVHLAVASALRRNGRNATRSDLLTEQERTVLRLAASGIPTAQKIAQELFVSESTVKTHLRSAYAKLGVADRAAAVAQAISRGIIEIG
jgi:two-component system nitrate/nitrite response regulator NarL